MYKFVKLQPLSVELLVFDPTAFLGMICSMPDVTTRNKVSQTW